MKEDPEKLLAMVRGLRAMKDLDPEDLLAALAEMRTMIPPEFRRAPGDLYERDYGHPIPTREETEARRRWEREEGMTSKP